MIRFFLWLFRKDRRVTGLPRDQRFMYLALKGPEDEVKQWNKLKSE